MYVFILFYQDQHHHHHHHRHRQLDQFLQEQKQPDRNLKNITTILCLQHRNIYNLLLILLLSSLMETVTSPTLSGLEVSTFGPTLTPPKNYF